MIVGRGAYADALRAVYDVPFLWIAEHAHMADGAVDVESTLGAVRRWCDTADDVVVCSTQLPVGTCERLEGEYPELRFVVQPENVREATAEQDLITQTRMVFGTRHNALHSLLAGVAAQVGAFPMFMGPEDAEMTKHAMNVYLALMVSYGNELGRLCEAHGADPARVVAALRTEPRVSRSAPLMPGAPPSQHLMREVHTMIALGAGPVIRALA